MICDAMEIFLGICVGKLLGLYTRRENGKIGASNEGDNDDRNYGG